MLENNINTPHIKKLYIVLVVLLIIAIIAIFPTFIKKEWYNDIDKKKMSYIAEQEIKNYFNSAYDIVFYNNAQLEFKDENYNKYWYIMFYKIDVTVFYSNMVIHDYFCSVKILFYKETMEYTISGITARKK